LQVLGVEQVLAPEEILANIEFEKFEKKLSGPEGSDQDQSDSIMKNIKPKPTTEESK
jgi:hypothetical protein